MAYPEHAKYIKERRLLERVRMVGPMSKSKEVMAALYDSGFRMVQTGPYTNKRMFPKCDDKRFLFIAEREVEA